jgi:hypothetical protein
MFRGGDPVGRYAALKLWLLRVALLRTNRFLRFRELEVARRRSLPKRLAARLLRGAATYVDGAIGSLAENEWRRRRSDTGGSVQYLVFRKDAES